MNDLVQVLLLTTMAGAAIPVGGAIAMVERISPDSLEQEFRHSVIAFGGGVLVSAVALVLVPDGIEELSLGWIVAAFAHGESTGMLLAILIALQNLPEGFNAYRELSASSNLSKWKLILLLAACVPMGPLAGWIGFQHLAAYPKVVGFIMLFAASGILYLMFQDLAPQSKSQDQRAPAIGAVLGFLLGVIGHVLLSD